MLPFHVRAGRLRLDQSDVWRWAEPAPFRDIMCLPLEQILGASDVLNVLFQDAFEQHCGRTALINGYSKS